jgi:uncharacterized small protein (DUF1192 family)
MSKITSKRKALSHAGPRAAGDAEIILAAGRELRRPAEKTGGSGHAKADRPAAASIWSSASPVAVQPMVALHDASARRDAQDQAAETLRREKEATDAKVAELEAEVAALKNEIARLRAGADQQSVINASDAGRNTYPGQSSTPLR